MLDYIAYLAAQQTGVSLSRSALPDAPVATGARPRRLRRRTTSALSRLAERIQPA